MGTSLATVQRFHGALTRSDERRLKLFKHTIGKDLQPHEIDEAIDWCEVFGANPFVKDIYFFVFTDKDGNRRLTPVLSIMMYRKIAARTKDYRPSEEPPLFTYDESLIGPANPRGIVDCTVTVWQHAHGAWHPIRERLRWDERAPIITGGEGGEKWEKTGDVYPPGHAKAGKPKYKKVPVGESVEKLDPGKPNWRTMGETMLAKCTEGAAIRKGWPEQTAGSYVDGEMDNVTIDLTATEIIEESEKQAREAKLGGPAIILDWIDGKNQLDRVPVDQVHGRVRDYIKRNSEEPGTLLAFWERNRASFREFWTMKPDECLDLKKAFEVYEAAAKADREREEAAAAKAKTAGEARP